MWCKSVGFVCRLAPLLILRSVGFLSSVLYVCSLLVRCLGIGHNGLGLAEVGEFKVQMLNKPLMLIEVQMLNLFRLPPFWQTLVSCSFSLFFLLF
jgi:hypothetical protein